MDDPQSTNANGCETVRFWVDNVAVHARNGDSIAAAMVAGGIYHFRQCRNDLPRGLFCGMGICGECQVLVDGRSTRACMEKADEGIKVQRHPPRRPIPDTARVVSDVKWRIRTPDVLVIGAGVGGLSAAVNIANSGLDVMVIDERSQPGGQFFKQPASEYHEDPATQDRQHRNGAALIERAIAAGIELFSGVVAWGVFGGLRIAVTFRDMNVMVQAKRVVIATGAYERPLAVPGWTLPGVMTSGAAQTLMRAYRTSPGARILIAGNGPLNLQVALEAVRMGANVVAVAEAAQQPARSPLQFVRMLVQDARSSIGGMWQAADLALRRIPVLYRHTLTRIDGDVSVRSATIGQIDNLGNLLVGSERTYEVDVVCMNYGFLPQAELARALGCAFEFDGISVTWRATRDADCQSSIGGVYIVGDASGLGGAQIAALEGEIAAAAICRDLAASQLPIGRSRISVRRRLDRHRRFQTALWQMFTAPALVTQFMSSDSIICRCENVTAGELEKALSDCCSSLAAIKKTTRIGMGRCQGRYCGFIAAAFAADAGYPAADANAFFAPRPPVKPMELGTIASDFGKAPAPSEVLRTNDRYANIPP